MKICPNCGTQYNDEDNFCEVCGARLDSMPEAEEDIAESVTMEDSRADRDKATGKNSKSNDELIKAVRALKNGDQEAFGTIYELTNKSAMAVIRRYCDNSADCEDILQDVYLKVYQSIGDLRDDSNAKAWINKIAANTAIRSNMKKKPTMFSEMEDDEGQEPEFEDESTDFNPEAISDRNVVSEIVREILDTLPVDQRDALWMVYGQMVTIREMAENLGISENTIKSRLYQGRQKMMARKADFRKYGIELSSAVIGILIAMSFEDTVYAAEIGAAGVGVAAAVGGTGTAVEEAATGSASTAASTGGEIAGSISAEATTASASAAGSASSSAATTAGAAGATASTAVATTTGLSLAAKIAIGAAVVAIGGGAAIGVTAYQRSQNTNTSVEAVQETTAFVGTEEYIPEEIIESEPEEIHISVESESWPEAFIDYLHSELDDYYYSGYYHPEYTLIYLDDDDIPELVRIGLSEAEGCTIIHFVGDGIEETNLFRLSFGYYERENLLDNASMHMGGLYENFYSIVDGKMTLIGEGYGEQADPYAPYDYEYDENGLPIGFNYEWNGQPVSSEEYNANVEAIYAGHDEANYKSYSSDNLYSAVDMINLLSFMESGVSYDAMLNPVITSETATELTEGQKAVILQALPEIIYWYANIDEAHEMQTSNFTSDDVLYWLQRWIDWDGLPGILNTVDHESIKAENGDYYSYAYWVDKESALKNVGDFFGKTITEEDVTSYKESYADNPIFMIDQDAIGVLLYADGEDRIIIPRIENYIIDNGILTMSLYYEVEWGAVPEGYETGHAKAVFRANPESFFGYSLESLTIEEMDDTAYQTSIEAQEEKYIEMMISRIQPHIVGISASSILSENGTTYSPSLILDGDPTTAWSEGSVGYGIDDSLMIMMDTTCMISGIKIYNGFQKSSDLYYKNSRPKEITVRGTNGQYKVELEDEMGEQTIKFDDSLVTTFIEITIDSVYPGTQYDDTLISDVVLF